MGEFDLKNCAGGALGMAVPAELLGPHGFLGLAIDVLAVASICVVVVLYRRWAL